MQAKGAYAVDTDTGRTASHSDVVNDNMASVGGGAVSARAIQPGNNGRDG